MTWLEIIELQSIGSNQALLESNLKSLINEVSRGAKNQSIKIYNHVSVGTDFSIHIHSESTEVDFRGSSLGLRLASNLKEFGLINYRVWIERFSK